MYRLESQGILDRQYTADILAYITQLPSSFQEGIDQKAGKAVEALREIKKLAEKHSMVFCEEEDISQEAIKAALVAQFIKPQQDNHTTT